MDRVPSEERTPTRAGPAARDGAAGPVDLTTAKVISDPYFVSASKIGITLLKPVRSVLLAKAAELGLA